MERPTRATFPALLLEHHMLKRFEPAVLRSRVHAVFRRLEASAA